MSNKAGSIAVICILTIFLIISVAIFFSTQNSLDNMQNVDSSNDQLPGASVLATIIGSLTVWLGFILGEFIVSMIGFAGSILAIKIAPSRVLKGISIGFFVFYSLIALVSTAAIVFVVIAIV
ncbi:MAG: hypothetical protein IJD74_05885 [Clostridia bacterium]|nr:hypothetical protein [Clostridia bacterium]MBR4032875.1 hypothetical protein [Clostridia bacterium]